MNTNYNSRPSAVAALFAAGLLSSTQTLPADTSSPWETTGAAGVALSEGNADSLSYTLQLLSTYEQGETEALLGADWFYAENNGVKSTDTFRAFGEYRRLLNDRFYFGINGSYLVDDIADIDYRVDLAAVAGYYFIKNDTTTLAFEAGPGYAWQEQGGIEDDYMTLRFGLRLDHQLSSRSKLWFSSIYTPAAEDFDDYLLISEAGIDTVLSQNWALRTAVRHQYDNTPAAGRDSTDTLLTVGLRYALGGFPEPAEEGRRTLKPADAAPKAIQMGWSSTAALTLAYADGNADNLSAGISYDTAYREDTREFFFTGSYAYAETAGTRSADSLLAQAQYNTLLSERTYIGTGVGFVRDDIADIDYRFTPAVTIGHYLIKEDRMTLSVEAGPGYTFEKVGGVKDDYFSLVAGEKFVYEVSDRVTFKQSLIAHIDPSDSDNYTLVADALLDTDITDNLSWRVAASWSYDNTPAAGKEKDDFILSSGIAVKF